MKPSLLHSHSSSSCHLFLVSVLVSFSLPLSIRGYLTESPDNTSVCPLHQSHLALQQQPSPSSPATPQSNGSQEPWRPNMIITYLNSTQDTQDEKPVIPTQDNNGITVYSNNALASQFNHQTWNTDCCSSPDLFNQIYNSSLQPSLLIHNTDNTHSLWITSYTISTQITTGLSASLHSPIFSRSSPIEIPPSASQQLTIEVSCVPPYDVNSYWAAIAIDLIVSSSPSKTSTQQETVNIYYFFVCDEKFRPIKYAFNLAFLTIFLVPFVYFQAIYSTPQSIICRDNFKRIEVKWYHASIYMFFAVAIVILNQALSPHVLQKTTNITMGIVSGIAAWFFISELQCTWKPYHQKVNRVLFKVSIFSFQVLDIISATVTGLLLFFWMASGKSWYSSDLLALCLLGSLMKLLKFKALKQAYGFLLTCVIVDSVGGAIVYLSQTLSYDTILLNDYNEPFLIAVPIWKMIYDKSCSWLPVTGTAFPGLLINLCFRFDRSQKNVSTKAFTYIGSIGYILGTMIYIFSTMFNIHTWPYSLVNYPVMGLFIFLFAYKRGDHLILWNGSFYDFDNSRAKAHVAVDDDLDQSYDSNNHLFDGLTINQTMSFARSDGDFDPHYTSDAFGSQIIPAMHRKNCINSSQHEE